MAVPVDMRELLKRLEAHGDLAVTQLWSETRAVIEAATALPHTDAFSDCGCEYGACLISDAIAAWVKRAKEMIRA